MRPAPTTEQPKRHREGNVALLTALTLTMMMMFVALSFDVGNIHRVRSEVQSAMDSAALAGASRLDGTQNGITLAKTLAVTQANWHKAYKGALAISLSDVTVGTWDFKGPCTQPQPTPCFTPWNTGNTSNAVLAQQFAVKVAYKVPSVAHPFAAVMGNASAPVGAFAVAVGGGPASESCGFPIVVPDCTALATPANGVCGYCMKNANANSDTSAWTSFFGNNGLGGIFDAIVQGCTTGPANCNAFGANACVPNVDPVTNECIPQGNCTNPVASGGSIRINNGNLFANPSSNNSACRLIQTILNRNGAANPKVFTVEVPVVETGVVAGGNCGAAQLAGMMTVDGFVKLDIYGARCGNGAGTLVIDNTFANSSNAQATCGNPPAGSYVLALEHCGTKDISQLGGGGAFGTLARTRLVQ